jgi:hypothetical protein
VKDFARLCVASRRVLPPGGSVETGVFRGGTAGILLHCTSPDSFHVSIDPYGLPGQSYVDPRDESSQWPWPEVRRTMTCLTAHSREITFCHYLMSASAFIRADHLQHPARFQIVHLDGDHSRAAVSPIFGGRSVVRLCSFSMITMITAPASRKVCATRVATSCRFSIDCTIFRRTITAWPVSLRGFIFELAVTCLEA